MNEIENNLSGKVNTWWSYCGITTNNQSSWVEANSPFVTNGLSTDGNNTANAGGVAIDNGKWITVRHTSKVTAVAADNSYTIQTTTYVNGVLASTSKTNANLKGDVLCFGFQFRGMDTGSYKMEKINVDFDDFVFSSYNTVVTPAETPEETPAE